MLDGLWQVYTKEGKYLGFCDSPVGGDTLLLSKKAEKRIKNWGINVGDILHIDEQYSPRALSVKIVRFFDWKDCDPALEFEIIEERESQYKKKKVGFRVNSYLFSDRPGR